MKIVVLLENHALSPALQAEHGLAVYLEKDGFRMVFDMGETGLFMENARTLGIDLSQLNAIAFSHNHYDHSGGFLSYVKCSYAPVPVYVHDGYFRRKWWDHSKDPVDEPTYENALELVGPVMTPEYFFQNGYMKFRMLAADVFEVAPDIYLTGNFALDRENEAPHPSSTMEIDPVTLTVDDFRDEQICVIRSKKGLVNGSQPSAGRRRHHRAERYDGRQSRGDPRRTRRKRLYRYPHHVVHRQIRLGILRPVP